jgi:cell division protein FtsB
MNINLLNPYQIIEGLKAENEELRKQIESLNAQIEEVKSDVTMGDTDHRQNTD